MRAVELSLAALAAVSAAHAQTPAPPQDAGLAEIVVTAQRRESRAQDTPVSLTALSGADLQARNVVDVRDVASLAPNLAASQGYGGGQEGFYFIRGVGQNDFSAAFDPGVGTYIDGVYIGRTAGSAFDLLDIERIEVLRGPQGTLFGRNTIGGAISVTSARPNDVLGGRVRLLAGERNRFEGALSVNVPIVAGKLASRVAVLARTQDGWGRRVVDDRRPGDVRTFTGRGALLWTPDDRVEVLFTVDGTHGRGTAPLQVSGGADATKSSPFGVRLPADINADRSADPFLSFADQRPINDLDVWGVSLDASIDLGKARLRSITAYRNLEQFSTADYDVSRYAFYNSEVPLSQQQFSQELQLTSDDPGGFLQYTVGLYYFREEVDQTNGIFFGATGPGGFGTPPARLDDRFVVINRQRITPTVDSYAAFGEATWAIAPTLRLITGIRYTHESKAQGYDFLIENRIPGLAPPFLPPGASFPVATFPAFPPTTARQSWDAVTPRLGVQWEPSKDVLLYATYSEGFRSGGFNSRPTTPDITSFDPETIATYEAGVKSELFGRRLRFNLSGFYSDYDAIQLGVVAGGFFNIANAGRAEIWGFEAEAVAAPVRGLQLEAAVGHLSDRYISVNPGTGFSRDFQLPLTPEWTVNLAAQYALDLRDAGTLTARIDWNYRAAVFFFADNAPGNLQPGYALSNMRVTYAPERGRWSVAAYGRNIFDTRYLTFAQDVRRDLGAFIQWPGAPREFGGEVTVRF